MKNCAGMLEAECFCTVTFRRHISSDELDPADKSKERPAIEKVPSPAYSETYGHVDFSQNGLDTEARVARMKSKISWFRWLTLPR